MKFTIDDIARVTRGRLIGRNPETLCAGVCIDTRKMEAGSLFVAIRGAHFDGHDFAADAQKQGAKAIVAKGGKLGPMKIPVIEVSDTLKALGGIAAWWRRKFSVPTAAITGSNGKSTTKEMTAAIADVLGGVLKTEGNFNNLIGLPLTIFRWNENHRAAILEMGMNAKGEIKELTEIADPTIGLITNATAAHLEKLHTVDAVASAKGELFDAMGRGATAVINGEDGRVMKIGKNRAGRKIIFGMQNGFDIQFLHMETENLDSMKIKVSIFGTEHEFCLMAPGAHNVMNAMAAIGIGSALGIESCAIVEALAKFRPMSMRFERVQLSNGVRIVNDSYNANPESMKAAFRTVGSARRAGRFIAALGDMLELGKASEALHREVGAEAIGMGVDKLYVLGDFAVEVAAGARESGLNNSDVIICTGGAVEMGRLIENELRAGDVLLVKGSRGMKMERVVEYLKNEIGTG